MEDISDITSTSMESNKEELLPQVQTVVNNLRNRANKKSSPWGNISVLLITIFLFLGSGLISNPILDIIIIIFVIIIHELGHLIAMKAYGYKDVKMFFIPFFGAAVTGKNENISSSKKAIISLAGPVPGITLGFLLLITSFFLHSQFVYKLSIMFIYLNALNLLPLFPFDGGRFMSEMFFIRNRYFEFIFKVIAVSIFIIAAIEFQDFILAFIGITLFFSIGTSYKLALLAKELKRDNVLLIEGSLIEQNNNVLNKVIYSLINKFPNPKGEHYYDNLIFDLWERLKYIPPKVSSSVGLSFSYIFFLFLPVSLFIPFGNSPIEYSQKNDTYFFNGNANDGIKYYPNGKVHIISSWKDGKRDGIWSEYDEQTILTAKYLFVDDRFVYKMKYVGGRFDTLTYKQLSQAEKEFILTELK